MLPDWLMQTAFGWGSGLIDFDAGEKGMGKSGKKLTYEGSHFHRIIPGFMIQGGAVLAYVCVLYVESL